MQPESQGETEAAKQQAPTTTPKQQHTHTTRYLLERDRKAVDDRAEERQKQLAPHLHYNTSTTTPIQTHTAHVNNNTLTKRYLLERDRESVDDRAENLEQLSDAVVSPRLVNKAEEHLRDHLADGRAI